MWRRFNNLTTDRNGEGVRCVGVGPYLSVISFFLTERRKEKREEFSIKGDNKDSTPPPLNGNI